MSVLVRRACRCRSAFLGSMGKSPCPGRTRDSDRAFPRVQGITVDPRDHPSPTLRLSPPCTCRNVDLLSIDYAFRPGLRCRLTPGGRTCPGKPWDSGDRNFHPVFRYSCPHNRWHEVHRRLRARLPPSCHALLPSRPMARPANSVRRLLPIIFGAGSLE